MNLEEAVAVARNLMRVLNVDPETAVKSISLIPDGLRGDVIAELERERADQGVVRIHDVRIARDNETKERSWLRNVDRQAWYYWPRLRSHLLLKTYIWSEASIRSLDDSTDQILACLGDPTVDRDFDVRGLVVGYVQSGKTANYSALIAKAADVGYRLVIVMAGIHDSLRQQTQRRLDAELVGRGKGSVPLPRDDRQWITLTTPDLQGDFSPGTVGTAPIGSGLPVLLVVKKNKSRLQTLNRWMGDLSDTARRLPVLVIDDEADQASINTSGNRPLSDDDEDVDASFDSNNPPSVINGLIRQLVNQFPRVAYVAYTATPFANVLIDHRAEDRDSGPDLYPKNFIVDLPIPDGYYGAERIFGPDDADSDLGINIVRRVPDGDVDALVPPTRRAVDGFMPQMPRSLIQAIDDFILVGAARMHRAGSDVPATMLVHATPRQTIQQKLAGLIDDHVRSLRDEWRYSRERDLERRLKTRWENDITITTQSSAIDLSVAFDNIKPYITQFLESESGRAPLAVLEINSTSEDILDYQSDPTLKAIVVGGNRLSRGLTLEGLLVSYYVRNANTYDTLMQMGRWFGFRGGYADLTRIYTTADLESWFRDLVAVEHDLRSDIRQMAEEGLTPLDVGVRIRSHPSLLVTDRLKMRKAEIEHMSFADNVIQTIVFPFKNTSWLQKNIQVTRQFLSSLGIPDTQEGGRNVWLRRSVHEILKFLDVYATDGNATRVRKDLITRYIREQAKQGELVEWVVGVMGQASAENPALGSIDLGVADGNSIPTIERTKLEDINSLKAIMSPIDQGVGLSSRQLSEAELLGGQNGPRLRSVRDKRQGLLLIYPISKYSGWRNGMRSARQGREPIFDDPESGEHVIGLGLVFPPSDTAATVEYVVGTVGSEAMPSDDFI